MSVTRLPTRPELGEDESLDDLEELGDDAIIAQQTAAHAPQPRAIVSEESRSVVISDHPGARKTQPPRGAAFPTRTAAEPTLIIRDRRRLEEMRQQIVERQLKNTKSKRSRSIYVWGALGVAAFVLGGVVAFLATDSHSDVPLPGAEAAAPPARVEAQVASPQPVIVSPARPPANPAPAQAATSVRLDDLPVEPAKKK